MPYGISISKGREAIDYRCEDGRSQVSAVSCVIISDPDSLSSSETRVNFGIRSFKSTYLNELNVRKLFVESISQREAEALQPGFVFDNLKPGLKSGIFQCIS